MASRLCWGPSLAGPRPSLRAGPCCGQAQQKRGSPDGPISSPGVSAIACIRDWTVIPGVRFEARLSGCPRHCSSRSIFWPNTEFQSRNLPVPIQKTQFLIYALDTRKMKVYTEGGLSHIISETCLETLVVVTRAMLCTGRSMQGRSHQRS